MRNDLRTFLKQLQATGEGWQTVEEELNADLGIPAYLESLQKKGQFPAVMFNNVLKHNGEKSNFPVLSNLFATRERLALGINSTVADLGKDMGARVKPLPVNLVDKDTAPVKQVIYRDAEIDAGMLPAVTHHNGDAGPYITAGSVWCRDVETGAYNCGVIRFWVKEKQRLGLHFNPSGHSFFHYRNWAAQNKPMPTVICVGHHPAFYMGTQAKVRGNEIEYIGGVMGEGLAVVPSETWGNDFLVPADAELVIEGHVLANVMEIEGPFGDFTGYTDPPKPHNVFEITAITMRKDMIYLDIFSGHRDHFLIDAPMLENLLYEQLRQVVPTVKRVYLPASACCRFHAYIQIDKTNDGQPKAVIARALTSDFRLKHVIVVDTDIDVEDEEAVLWAVSTRSQWNKDILVLDGVNGSVLDPSGDNGLTAKGGIDATVPLAKEFPAKNYISLD